MPSWEIGASDAFLNMIDANLPLHNIHIEQYFFEQIYVRNFPLRLQIFYDSDSVKKGK